MSEAAAVDRISECLLHHIHSFLDIKDGARTSVLSKRWNCIWTTVPTLDFQNQAVYFKIITSPNTKQYTDFMDGTSKDTEKFMDFVDGTLHRHISSNVDKFFLQWNLHLNESRLHSWISTVIRGNVKEVKLYLHQAHPLFIPLSLFTCQSLTLLELDTRPDFRLPKYISFPRLKRLQLHNFKFTYESWNEELFSNSPVLEELILNQCAVSMKIICISIPTLKLLELHIWGSGADGLQDCVLEIVAPRLVTFSYSGYVAKEFVLSTFLSLTEATVFFHIQKYYGAEEVSQLLRALAHVKCLNIYNTTFQAICSAYDMSNNLLTFHNLKKLKMLHGPAHNDKGLISLLKAVPNLEALFVLYKFEFLVEEEDTGNAEGKGSYDTQDDSWAIDFLATGCIFSHLKSVFFGEFSANPREMRWVKLILRYAKALQMMTLRYCRRTGISVKSEKEVMAEIPSFPRASPGCVIKFI